MYWAEALAEQDDDADLKKTFSGIPARLRYKEKTIVDELNSVQGQKADLGGYYKPDAEKVAAIMRPSSTFNRILGELSASVCMAESGRPSGRQHGVRGRGPT